MFLGSFVGCQKTLPKQPIEKARKNGLFVCSKCDVIKRIFKGASQSKFLLFIYWFLDLFSKERI